MCRETPSGHLPSCRGWYCCNPLLRHEWERNEFHAIFDRYSKKHTCTNFKRDVLASVIFSFTVNCFITSRAWSTESFILPNAFLIVHMRQLPPPFKFVFIFSNLMCSFSLHDLWLKHVFFPASLPAELLLMSHIHHFHLLSPFSFSFLLYANILNTSWCKF